jgi:hypothetical protein
MDVSVAKHLETLVKINLNHLKKAAQVMRVLNRFLQSARLSCLRDALTKANNYAEKEEPQPQVVFAFGLRMINCAPSISSL